MSAASVIFWMLARSPREGKRGAGPCCVGRRGPLNRSTSRPEAYLHGGDGMAGPLRSEAGGLRSGAKMVNFVDAMIRLLP
jgi:hypothetical protein